MTQPWSVDFDSTGNKVYVGSEYGHCVIAIDATTHQRIARIPVGLGGRALGDEQTGVKLLSLQGTHVEDARAMSIAIARHSRNPMVIGL